MKHLILGTAGHIDHGKTSLVKALTGIDTDRLKEEKARGITIELGFAHLELPDGVQFGIVDVPGHERFVRAMVAGVGGMDLVMLVIAADEGIMPQTREHLEICQLLGVKRGLVALTKRDMVDADWLGLVTEEVRDYLAGSFLDGAPVIPVSSRTGAGLDQLRTTLGALAAAVEPKRSDGPFRLPVDRVFTVTGFGTVVTGTLLSGQIRVGDEVAILPGEFSSRVRGLQTHGSRADTAEAGQRLAVNLQGIEHTQVCRGDVVVPAGLYQTTRVVDVRLQYLASAPRPLKHRSTLRLHSATYEVAAQVILLEGDTLEPGQCGLAQLRLAHPVLLLPGDPFVLRKYSPQATLGGGTVLDPQPPRRRRRSAEATELLQAIEDGDESAMLARMVDASLLSGLSFAELVNRTGLSARRLESALAPLLASGEILQLVREPKIYLGRAAAAALKKHLLDELAASQRDGNLKDGIGKEELKTRLPRRTDQRFFTPLLTALEKEGKVIPDRDLVKLPGQRGGVTAGQSDLQLRLQQALTAGGTEPPTIKELCDLVRQPEKTVLEHLNYLAREGRTVKVKSDLFYAPAPVGEIREKLLAWLREKGEITPNEFRDLTGLSRKFMIPLLEFFDAEKITIRVGDKRLLRKR
jgi:selenocysteine-specific elongation factor